MSAKRPQNPIFINFCNINTEDLYVNIAIATGCSSLQIPKQDRPVHVSGLYNRLGEISIRHMRYHGSMSMKLNLEEDATTFILTTNGKLAVNQPIDALGTQQSSLAINKQTIKLLNILDMHEHYGMSIPHAALTNRLSTLLEKPTPTSISFDITRSTTLPQQQALFSLLKLLTSPEQETLLKHSMEAPRHMRELLLDSVLELWPHNYSVSLARPVPSIKPRHVKIAVDYIEAHADSCLSAEGLAQISGTGVRALQEGFRKFVGMSILHYQRNVRLQRCHSDLLRDPALTVSEVAHRWGFSNVTRFCSYFRQAYGVTPAEFRLHRH